MSLATPQRRAARPATRRATGLSARLARAALALLVAGAWPATAQSSPPSSLGFSPPGVGDRVQPTALLDGIDTLPPPAVALGPDEVLALAVVARARDEAPLRRLRALALLAHRPRAEREADAAWMPLLTTLRLDPAPRVRAWALALGLREQLASTAGSARGHRAGAIDTLGRFVAGAEPVELEAAALALRLLRQDAAAAGASSRGAAADLAAVHAAVRGALPPPPHSSGHQRLARSLQGEAVPVAPPLDP